MCTTAVPWAALHSWFAWEITKWKKYASLPFIYLQRSDQGALREQACNNPMIAVASPVPPGLSIAAVVG